MKVWVGVLMGLGWLMLASGVSAQGLWQIQSIDTMKYSRDASRDPAVAKLIPGQVKIVAEIGANYIGLGTPYDEEFVPRLKLWVAEARANDLKIWFRGNLSGWEGWFDHPKFSDPKQHHQLMTKFITTHPELFEDGDIITPIPEPENGVLGDPRQTGRVAEFNQFLVDSFNNCQAAVKKINKNVKCGYFSTNGDIANLILTRQVIDKIGGVIVVDHYVRTPERLVSDIEKYHQKFEVPVVLGEFGAPIPDLQGVMTEKQQADYIDRVLAGIYRQKDFVEGMNYWVLSGGSTTLLNDDQSPRQVVEVLKKYFRPITISGQITDPLGGRVRDYQVSTDDGVWNLKAEDSFSVSVPVGKVGLKFEKSGFATIEKVVESSQGGEIKLDLVMDPTEKDWWYEVRLWLKEKNIQLPFVK